MLGVNHFDIRADTFTFFEKQWHIPTHKFGRFTPTCDNTEIYAHLPENIPAYFSIYRDIIKIWKREGEIAVQKKNTWREICKARYIYMFLLPGLIWYGLFYYQPMYGLLMAFKKFNARLGVMGSPWVGLSHFQRIFITPDSIRALTNTFLISFERLIFEFPAPILVALLLNEMRGTRVKRIYQTVFTFPHFLSWVIVAAILKTLLGNSGALNELIVLFGSERINFLADTGLARPLLFVTSIWKEAGWSAILYIAGISGINPEYYEAATVDGASRLQRIWHITLPGIRPTIVVMFILAVGNVMNGGFDQIFNIRNSAISKTLSIIDTYVYDITFQATPNYGFSTAVGMFKSLVNLLMLNSANLFTRKLTGEGLFK